MYHADSGRRRVREEAERKPEDARRCHDTLYKQGGKRRVEKNEDFTIYDSSVPASSVSIFLFSFFFLTLFHFSRRTDRMPNNQQSENRKDEEGIERWEGFCVATEKYIYININIFKYTDICINLYV